MIKTMKTLETLKGSALKHKKKTVLLALIVLLGLTGAVFMASGKGGMLTGMLNKNKVGAPVAEENSGIKQPDRTADIVGIVESVSGNEVKILKLNAADLPTGQGLGGQQRTGSGSGSSPSGQSGGQRQRPSDMGQGYGNGPGQASGAGNAAAKSARAAMIAELKKKSIGEDTVIVPVGIQMIKQGRPTGAGGPDMGSSAGGSTKNAGNTNNTGGTNNAGNGGTGQAQMGGQAASITDITTDGTVMIWLNASVTDKKVAEFVSIMG